jgi:hypothetical protein
VVSELPQQELKICAGGIRHLELVPVVFLVLTEKNSEAEVDS